MSSLCQTSIKSGLRVRVTQPQSKALQCPSSIFVPINISSTNANDGDKVKGLCL